MQNYGILLRIIGGSEYSDYSLSYMKNIKDWKCLVEVFHKDGKVVRIQDIYGGGESGQDCIICFCEPSDTMIKPCNHLCLCKECAGTMQAKTSQCPICRKKIHQLVTLNKI